MINNYQIEIDQIIQPGQKSWVMSLSNLSVAAPFLDPNLPRRSLLQHRSKGRNQGTGE